MPTLEHAIALALSAHTGQKDKVGEAYILHPLRVMLNMPDTTTRIIAVLHDVVEDSPITLEDLREHGYSEEIIIAIDCLTRREGESYEVFIQRIKPNALARQVKFADLQDNMNIHRLKHISAEDAGRLQRYKDAWTTLQDA